MALKSIRQSTICLSSPITGKRGGGAISDMSHNGWMTTPEIRKSIEKGMAGEGKQLDVIAFDACLMASAEVAYELKDVAQYMVASEETEGAAGWSLPAHSGRAARMKMPQGR